MIVLMDGVGQLKPAEQEAVQSVGLLMFHDLNRRNQAMVHRVTAPDITPELLGRLLDRIEAEPAWFDADRLAFKELLTQLHQHHSASQSIAGLKLAKRAQEDLQVLAELEQAYEKELKDTFGRFAQRGIVLQREKWTDYVAKLKQVYQREQILKDYATILPLDRPQKPEPDRELFGRQLPPKTVVLSFDDGPHPRYTDEVLDILRRYQAPAIFFQVGQNLGRVDTTGQVFPGPGAEVARRVLQAGHQLANHSFTHSMLSKVAQEQVRDEAARTEALLNQTGRSGQALFRFPYGARNDDSLSTIEALKLRSMMWNIDSLDWSDPIPKSIAARVLDEVQKQQRGIILFHDIHARTVQALPLVLDQLVAEGYRFASWRDGQFVTADRKPLEPEATTPGAAALYRASHALIVGIDQYQRWPRLQHAARDARAVHALLQSRFGFSPERMTLLVDGDATRTNILRALNRLSRDVLKRDDRVLVFFAGHGSTRKLPNGRDVGYIIPVDAGLDDLQTDAVAMPQLQELSEALPAKHALFVIDACYSGLGLTRGGGSSANFIRDNARRMGRQMMTAGGADQQVADDGPGGHSVFTWTFLQALSGKADLNNDGLITATELAAYVAPAVSAVARQTPAFGSLPGSEGGEFVFELGASPEGGLSADSGQMDAQASALARKLDETRPTPQGGPAGAGVRVKVQGLDGKEVALATPTQAADPGARVLAQRANDRGLQLYRERRYDEAEAAFTEALKLQPRFALAANNLGFVYYRKDKPLEAARWFEKALEMDGSRALAWLNLGDARLQLGEDTAAQRAYARFVELAPQHGRVAELRAWLAQPDAAHRPRLPGA